LKLQVAETAPGSTVPVKILREGREQSVNLTVKELPGTEEIAKAGDKNDSSNDALNGVTVSDLDPAAKGQLKLPQNIKGAVVTQVEQDSPAYDAGLRPGDVIEEINRKTVQTADEAVKLTENMKEKKILLKIWSGGASHYMVVDENKAG
jgi:serine protease Do